jgi:lipopolysaccharide export system permease protein
VWRFHKYYIRELCLNLLLTFVMLFGITLIALLARGIYRSQGAGLWLALLITVLWAMDILPELLSVAILVASVFTFGRAAADNEITAMRMAGISPLRLMGAVLTTGALAAALNCWLLHDTIPTAHYYKYRPSQSLLQQFLISNRSTQNRWELDDLTMIWDRMEPLAEGSRFHGVDFKARAGDGRWIGQADSVEIGTDASGEKMLLRIRRFRGRQPGSKTVVQLHEIQLSFDLREIAERNKRHEGMKDLRTAQLVAEVCGGTAERAQEARWQIWQRTCQGLSALLFAVVGFPIGLLCRRSGRMVAFAVSFLPLVLYYALNYLAPWLSRSTGAVWPVVLPDLGLLGFGLWLCRRAFRL